MTAARSEIIELIWNGIDPFSERSTFDGRCDPQGWASDNPMLFRAIQDVAPKIVVEVGVWKGGSVTTMAKEMKRLDLNGVVIAVDTWLGASEHWLEPFWFKDLRLESGFPTLFKTFAANIIEAGITEYVVPLPLDSLNAAALLKAKRVCPNVIHIDGGHDYHSVIGDLNVWWPMIAPGGALVGDDYHPIGIEVWPEVRAAFHDYFHVTELEHWGGKCLIRKNIEQP